MLNSADCRGRSKLSAAPQLCSRRCGGPRFGRSQNRLKAYLACARMCCPAFIWSDVVLVTYVTLGSTLLKTHTAHAFLLTFSTVIHIGILDVLLTETMLVTTDNPGPLPSRFHIRQTRNLGPAESMTTLVLNDDLVAAVLHQLYDVYVCMYV